MHSVSGLPFAAVMISLLSACASHGLSPAEAEREAQHRYRQELGLAEAAKLRSHTFVGREWDGDKVLCGTVSRVSADNGTSDKRFFILTLDPVKWLLFGPNDTPGQLTHPSNRPDWTRLCAGAEAV